MEVKMYSPRSQFRKLASPFYIFFLIPLSSSPALSQTVTYNYDLRGRLLQVTSPNASTTAYEYDNTGNLTAVKNPPLVTNPSTPQSYAGLTITLTGVNFTGATAVLFGTVAAQFTVLSDTQISVIVPYTTTSGVISVITPSGTVASTSTFAVVPSSAPAVSQDPTIAFAASASAPASYSTISTAAIQYFTNGSTFPSLALRKLLDFYGVAIPKTAANIGEIGSLGTQPLNSPLQNTYQFNYCSSGTSRGIATFTGTATIPTNCSFVFATAGKATIIGAPNQAPTPLPSTATGYTVSSFPSFPAGPSANLAVATNAPLFAFSEAAASTAALSSTDRTNYTNNKKPTRGNPIQVPVFFGAIVPALNAGINGGVSPNLTTIELCKVFDGQITNFNKLANTPTLNVPIKLAVRSDGSGTTTAFTAYLASACATAGVVTPGYPGYYLPAAVSTFPTTTGTPSAAFVRKAGDDGLGDYVATTAGGFGYIASSYIQPFALKAPITSSAAAPIQAALQNPLSSSFLTANATSIRNALGNIGLSVNATYPCVLSVTGLPVVPTVSSAYPIVTQTYALTYTNYATQAEVNAVKGAFSFILGDYATSIPANDQITQASGLVLLGKGTTTSTINPLRSQARACINSAKPAVGSN
jgi:YD repeat-containing protein